MHNILFNVDRLFVHEGMWRVSGWCFHETENVKSVAIALSFAGGEIHQRLATGLYRDDVARDFPRFANSAHSGFNGFGLGRGERLSSLRLMVELDNGERVTLDITRFLNRYRQYVQRVWAKIRRASFLIRQGRLREVREKTWEFTRRGLKKLYARRLQRIGADILIFDHAMGGGANLFSERLANKLCAGGQSILFVRFSIEDLSFELEYRENTTRRLWQVSSQNLFASLKTHHFKTIIVNTLAPYLNATIVLGKIVSLARKWNAGLHYYFHDHHSICPSPFLLDYKGRYCGIPDLETCAKCLSLHSDIFVTAQNLSRMEPWREAWGQFLAACTEIRFFSEASYQTFRRVYSKIDHARCVVEPHDTSYMAEEIGAVRLRPVKSLRIGVVGHISSSKGAQKLKALCDYIAESSIAAEVIVIGTVDSPITHPFVKVTGPYHINRLGRIVERERINVAFFPSICPETFSYTISELLYMELPVVAFDLGAPAERLEKRTDSVVLPLDTAPADILAALGRIALRSRAAPASLTERSKICAFTSAATNYLPKALLLGESLQRFHPEIDRYYGLGDARREDIDYQRGVFTGVLESRDLHIPEFNSWRLRHSIVEFCTAVKPFMVERLLDEGYELVLYFDPDMVLFSRLDDLIEKAMQSSIVLTPHLTKPEQEVDAILDNEIYGALQHGTYNLGFLGVRNTPEGRRFVRWWADRLYRWCKEDVAMGLWTDQKWIDLAPGFFEEVGILREARFNVAPWNIGQRHFAGSLDSGFQVDGKPLGFYHFTGFDSGAHRVMAAKYGQGNKALMALIDWYQEKTRFAANDPAAAVKWEYR